jgi:tetratricopeptide (TPR) repeat protein
LKKFSHQLQPYLEALRVIEEVHKERPTQMNLDAIVLNHMVSFAEHQYGDRVPGKAYRERAMGNGSIERLDNFFVEIEIFCSIYYAFISLYQEDESLSQINIHNLILPYLEKILGLLRLWSTNIDLMPTSDNLDKDRIKQVLNMSSQVENDIGSIHIRRNQFDQAESHFQRALTFARLYEGNEEDKADLLCEVLREYISLRASQGIYTDAVIFAEEAYNSAAVAYHPVHPKVQKAAGTLVECLVHTGDRVSLYNGERFAQATLDSLKDPANGLDQGSEALAKGHYDLANVISKQKGDLVKAAMLARESLRIRSQLYCHDHLNIALNCNLLADILQDQNKQNSETKELYERSLAITIKHSGPDAKNAAITNHNLGFYHHALAEIQENIEIKEMYLFEAYHNYTEALRIYTIVLGPDNSRTLQTSSMISMVQCKICEI